ncbi:MAG: methylated-DNA--[protein]-cysteine S-methyltransferase [Rickettsiales bacterium]|nr:methylated-DNA--[protein]-cysteine S-methyltransferase [Rickettsiales bacterium]
MTVYYEALSTQLQGAQSTLRFVWSDAGLQKVQHAAMSEPPLDAVMVENKLLQRFPALASVIGLQPFDSFAVPLDLQGTDFQRSVWNEIARIPLGQTISYTQLALRVGRPDAVRAVASACGANPVPLVIPCHRVIASDGGLGGYIWGVEYKHALLFHEQNATHPLMA